MSCTILTNCFNELVLLSLKFSKMLILININNSFVQSYNLVFDFAIMMYQNIY